MDNHLAPRKSCGFVKIFPLDLLHLRVVCAHLVFFRIIPHVGSNDIESVCGYDSRVEWAVVCLHSKRPLGKGLEIVSADNVVHEVAPICEEVFDDHNCCRVFKVPAVFDTVRIELIFFVSEFLVLRNSERL